MPDVFPRRNLNPDAEQWGREVENRATNAETALEIIKQDVQSQNRNTASSLSVLAGQIKAVQDAQAAIVTTQAQIQAAQADIVAAQSSIIATTNFLSTQTVFEAKSTIDTFTGSNTGTTWRGFDATYDCSVTVTTGNAGKLLIQASANLTGGGLSALIGIEIVGLTGPDFPGPLSTYVTDASAGVTRVVGAPLTPNTTYTVRTRRGINGSTSGAIIWRDQTLVVTRS